MIIALHWSNSIALTLELCNGSGSSKHYLVFGTVQLTMIIPLICIYCACLFKICLCTPENSMSPSQLSGLVWEKDVGIYTHIHTHTYIYISKFVWGVILKEYYIDSIL